MSDDYVKLNGEVTVNGNLWTISIEVPRSMWDNEPTDPRREKVMAVIREKLAKEIAGKLDVTVTEERPVSGEGKAP